MPLVQYWGWSRWGRVKDREKTCLIGPFDCPLVPISEFNATLRRKTEHGDYERVVLKHNIESEDLRYIGGLKMRYRE